MRAGMVETAAQWRWSSAAAHCAAATTETGLELEPWRQRWTVADWIDYLAVGESSAEVAALRQFTHTGRPLGNAAFVAQLEQSTMRRLAPRERGRRRKPAVDPGQQQIAFVA